MLAGSSNAECLGGVEVDDHLELGWAAELEDRQA
jgi:hypothetical protein